MTDNRKVFISTLAAVVIPIVQALVTGALVALVVLAFAIYQGHAHPWLAAGVSFALVTLLAWLGGLAWWRSVVYGADPPNEVPASGIVYGAAAAPVETVRIELSSDGGAAVDWIDLPVTLGELIKLSAGLVDGGTFSESAWTGRGNLFSRAKFSRLRIALLSRGLIGWNSPGTPARGVYVTRGGMACFRHFAGMAGDGTPSPLTPAV